MVNARGGLGLDPQSNSNARLSAAETNGLSKGELVALVDLVLLVLIVLVGGLFVVDAIRS